MSAAQSSEASVRLSAWGFKKVYNAVRHDHPAAAALADEIEASPRETLERIFKLTKKQKEAIGNTSDAELRRRARRLLTALRSPEPEPLSFHAQGDNHDGSGHILSCTCMITPD